MSLRPGCGSSKEIGPAAGGVLEQKDAPASLEHGDHTAKAAGSVATNFLSTKYPARQKVVKGSW